MGVARFRFENGSFNSSEKRVLATSISGVGLLWPDGALETWTEKERRVRRCFGCCLGYAAIRGLPDCSGLSNKSFIHHSTMSQSRNGRSMTLAKCILSQNVRRVRVCKRFPLPSRTARSLPAEGTPQGGRMASSFMGVGSSVRFRERDFMARLEWGGSAF